MCITNSAIKLYSLTNIELEYSIILDDNLKHIISIISVMLR